MRAANVRFYFDADILGLGKIVCSLRWDATYPGDPGAIIHKRERAACSIAPNMPDREWIPDVAQRDWLMITRDSNIQAHIAEINAVLDNGGRMVALAGQDAGTVWGQPEVLMTQWRAIEQLLTQNAPFIYTAMRTSLRRVAP